MPDRQIKPGDRAQIVDNDIVGEVADVSGTVARLKTPGQTYVLPLSLLWWLPPEGRQEWPVGQQVRNAQDLDDERRWWHFPSSTDGTWWIETWQRSDKVGFFMRRRDLLPDRIVAAPSVQHTPDDQCICEPYGNDRCGYRVLADLVVHRFNPPDDDVAEMAVIETAVVRAAEFIDAQPCACTPEQVDDHDPCPRCAVLGRLGDKPTER